MAKYIDMKESLSLFHVSLFMLGTIISILLSHDTKLDFCQFVSCDNICADIFFQMNTVTYTVIFKKTVELPEVQQVQESMYITRFIQKYNNIEQTIVADKHIYDTKWKMNI